MVLLAFWNPADCCQSKVPSGFMLAYFLPPVFIISMCVCVCVFSLQNKCKSSSSVYRVCTAKPITTYECTVSSITALGPFISSANLDISVRWLFTQSIRERDIFLSWLQTQVLSFNIIDAHFNCWWVTRHFLSLIRLQAYATEPVSRLSGLKTLHRAWWSFSLCLSLG